MKTKAVIVSGGCGYIGSHLINVLLNQTNLKIICIDNHTGKSVYKFNNKRVSYYKKNIADKNLIKSLFKNYRIKDVYHFAALKNVHESNYQHEKYLNNNLFESIIFLKTLLDNKIENFIFSSSAAIYGSTKKKKSLKESDAANPRSVYGLTKSMFEEYIYQLSNMYRFNFGILRYFNVVGKNQDLNFKLNIDCSHSLFDNCCKSIILRKKIKVFGNDFSTKDGTAIRDYIHVDDLVRIHFLALKFIKNNKKQIILNCGYGKGNTVLNIINKFEQLYTLPIKKTFVKRNELDPEISVADTMKLKRILNFKPAYQNLELMIKSHMNLF